MPLSLDETILLHFYSIIINIACESSLKKEASNFLLGYTVKSMPLSLDETILLHFYSIIINIACESSLKKEASNNNSLLKF